MIEGDDEGYGRGMKGGRRSRLFRRLSAARENEERRRATYTRDTAWRRRAGSYCSAERPEISPSRSPGRVQRLDSEERHRDRIVGSRAETRGPRINERGTLAKNEIKLESERERRVVWQLTSFFTHAVGRG